MAKSKKTTTKADKVRSRRSRSSRTPVKSARASGDPSTHRMPPVMVRGGSYVPSLQTKKRKKTKNVKRRYDISLPTPGATGVEIRLPSLPVMRISWRLLSMALVVGLVFLLYYMLTAPFFQVQTVEVQGIIRLTVDEISRSMNVINQPIFSLDPSELEHALDQNFAELKDISIGIGLPAQVLINVNERVPLIEWSLDSEKKWIDGDGYAFPQHGDVDNLVSVVAYAPPPQPVQLQVETDSIEMIQGYQAYLSPDLVSAILTIRPQAPEGTDLIYEPKYGLGWKDPQGWDVFFGVDADDIDMKLQVYKTVAKEIKSEGITPALINLEHVHAPYYRMER